MPSALLADCSRHLNISQCKDHRIGTTKDSVLPNQV
uniref:Uncharacterized protein n=1 Tax=Arundo donax TaxID=35708 RepID=A0A0A9F955_ARUDO